jgi:5-methylcytosine-specific restriction protein A
MRVCSVPGCPELYDGTHSRCPNHRKQADKARGTARDRGYNTPGHRAFRAAVLAKHPICVLCNRALSTVADHYPRSRKELIAQGLNPNDPDAGRGLCKPCHDRHTAQAQPGGWNARP